MKYTISHRRIVRLNKITNNQQEAKRMAYHSFGIVRLKIADPESNVLMFLFLNSFFGFEIRYNYYNYYDTS